MCLKKKLEQELTELKQATDSVEEYKKAFSKYFKTLISDRVNTNVLQSLYYDFIEQAYKPTTVYQFLLNEICNTYDQIVERLDDEGKKLFEKYEFLQREFSNDNGLQSFIYGYCLANTLNAESTRNIKVIQEQLNKLNTNTDTTN